MDERIRLYVVSGRDRKVIDNLRKTGLDFEVINATKFKHGELFRDFRTVNTPILVLPPPDEEIIAGTERILSKARKIKNAD